MIEREQPDAEHFLQKSRRILDRYKSTRVKSPAFRSVLSEQIEQLRQVKSSIQILDQKEHLLDLVEQILKQPDLVELDLLVRYLSEIVRIAENIGLGLTFTQKYVDQAIEVYRKAEDSSSAEDALLELYLAKAKFLRLAQLENLDRERTLEVARAFTQTMQRKEEGLIKVLIAFAEYHTEVSQYEKSIKMCQEGEQILKENPKLEYLYYPRILTNYGMNYFTLLDYKRAKTYLLRARRMLDKNLVKKAEELNEFSNERTMATVLHYLGRITREVKGNLQDTMQFYVDGDKYQQMCPEELSASAFYHLRIGELLIAADRLKEAKDHIRESERFFCDIEWASSGRVQTALAWASIYDKEGNYLRAKEYIKDAIADAHEKVFSRGELLCLVALFWLELRHYKVLSAIRIFFQAMSPWRNAELGRNGGIKLVRKYLLQVLSTPFKLFLRVPHNILGTATFNAPISHCTCPIHVQKSAEANKSNTKRYPRKVLRFLSYNVGQNLSGYDSLDTLIRKCEVDIVLLQEITSAYAKKFQSELSHFYPHQVYGPFLGEHLVGMGILSRHPIVDIENFKLATDGLIFQQRASIMLEDKTITVYNIHLTPPRIYMKRNAFFSHVPWLIYDDYTRREEVKNFVALIKGHQAPIVAAGDFNFSNHSREYRLLAAFLNDAYHLVGQGSGFTWPVRCIPSVPIAIPCVRIDYLFHSSSFQSYSALVGEQTGSDHLPLLLEIALEN